MLSLLSSILSGLPCPAEVGLRWGLEPTGSLDNLRGVLKIDSEWGCRPGMIVILGVYSGSMGCWHCDCASCGMTKESLPFPTIFC